MIKDEPAGAGWSREVLDFIDACRFPRLGGIRLTEAFAEDRRAFIDVTADYISRRGRRIPVRVYWVDTGGAKSQRISLRGRSAPLRAGAAGFSRLALRAGLLLERKRAAGALRAAVTVGLTATIARNRLVADYLGVVLEDVKLSAELMRIGIDDGFSVPDSRAKIAAHRAMAVATLNDLAHVHSNGKS
jgi:hypothetical protein